MCTGSPGAVAAWFGRRPGKQLPCAEPAEKSGARRGRSASRPRLQMWKELETALCPLGAALRGDIITGWDFYWLGTPNKSHQPPPPSRLHSALASHHLTHKHCSHTHTSVARPVSPFLPADWGFTTLWAVLHILFSRLPMQSLSCREIQHPLSPQNPLMPSDLPL